MRHRTFRNTFGKVWGFRTARFEVSLYLERDRSYRYDGDDEDGDIRRKLHSGEYVAFDSRVTVELDGEEIAFDHLGGSVYGADDVAQFYTSHRDADAMNRNCSIMRANHPSGPNVSICHHFPGMVAQAIQYAREELASRKAPPRMRAA